MAQETISGINITTSKLAEGRSSMYAGINFIKFAGGLFTLFSSNLLKYIDIPD